MCPLTIGQTASGASPAEIDALIWSEIERSAANVGSVLFCGFGETLLDRSLLDRMAVLDRQRVQFSFTTNGTLITHRVVEQLNQFAYLTHINVSIDSPDPETYRAIRGGKVEKALGGLAILARGTRALETLTVSSVLSPESLPSLSSFPSILADLGVRDYIIQRLTDWDAVGPKLSPSDRLALLRAFRRLKKAAKARGVRLHYDRRIDRDLGLASLLTGTRRESIPPDGSATRVCTAPWEVPFIDKDGRVYPCCNSVEEGAAAMGDLRRTPFEEIWSSATFQDFRDRLLSGSDLPDACRKCGVAPMGSHPFNRVKATLESVVLSSEGRVTVSVRNRGAEKWGTDHLFLSTLRMRSTGNSDFRHRSWLSQDRICAFRESRVQPDDAATFVFSVGRPEHSTMEVFQIVTSAGHWLPDTQFRLTFDREAGAIAVLV